MFPIWDKLCSRARMLGADADERGPVRENDFLGSLLLLVLLLLLALLVPLVVLVLLLLLLTDEVLGLLIDTLEEVGRSAEVLELTDSVVEELLSEKGAEGVEEEVGVEDGVERAEPRFFSKSSK